MASVFRRRSPDGGLYPRWSYRWTDSDGRRRSGTGGTDKAATRRVAEKLEDEARLIHAGILRTRDVDAAAAGRLPLARHVADYRLYLIDKGATRKHAQHAAGVILRILCDVGCKRLPEITQDGLQAALRRLKDVRSSRTANHALGAAKGFLRWCYSTCRLAEDPRWLVNIRRYPERVDRRRVRRVLTSDELARLFKVTEAGPDEISYGKTRCKARPLVITGSDRVILYRLAVGTGLRAGEIRSLTPENFDLAEGCVICRAANTKNHREAKQPLSGALCDFLTPWLAGKPQKEPVFLLPWCVGNLLSRDLKRAGIPIQTSEGILDFHSLRHAYISNLIARGIDPKTVQELARHSTITLTIDRYSHTDDERKRLAVDSIE